MATQTVLARKAYRTMSSHYWATLLMVAGLVPALRMARLPLRFTWVVYSRVFWGSLVPEAIVGGVILYVVGAPVNDSMGPLFRRCSRQKLRIILILALALVMMLTLGIRSGFLATVATIVMLEVKERVEENHISLLKMMSDVFWPATYMFFGGVVMSAYNEAIVALRYNGAAEFVLKRWDSVLLGGHSVSGIAHAFIGRWPGSIPWMELIYFGTFAQTGGCLTILALTEGRRRTLQYIGTILMAFYFALAFFYLWPATGPYASCAGHFSIVPNGPVIYHLQQSVLVTMERIHSGPPLTAITPAYFIALPSGHFIQILIVLWFLRRWKRLLILMIAYDVLLVAAILLLENHYLVDLIAAVPVAALAIAISGRDTHTSTATTIPRTSPAA